MKGKSVKTAKLHVGSHHFAASLTVEAAKHKVKMELTPVGVYCDKGNGTGVMIPFTNITHIDMEDDKTDGKKA